MRTFLKFALLALVSLLAVRGVCAQSTITWTNVHQTMDGFGAGTGFQDPSCFPNCGQPTETTAAADFYFTTLGLEYVKSTPAPNGTITWDLPWKQAAIARGTKVSMLMSCPPANLMSDGVYCSSTGSLLNTNYTAYANFIVTAIQANQSNGVTITNLGIQNEPNLTHNVWTGCSGGTIAICLDNFIKNNLGPALDSAGLSIPLILGDTAGWFSSDYVTTCMNDANCAKYVTIIGSHEYDGTNATWGFVSSGGYCCNTPTVPSESGVIGTRHLWMDEVNGGFSAVGCNGNLWTFDASMNDALVWAHNIHGYLTIPQVNGYFYWNLFNYNGSNCNDGLTGPGQSFTPAKRAYIFGNWSKFIKSGWQRIDATANPASGVFVTAFKDPASGNFTIVAENCAGNATVSSQCTGSSGPVSVTFNLSGFPTTSGTITPTITDSTRNLAAQTNLTGVTTSFTYSLPTNSVTTFTGTLGASTPAWTGIIAANRAVDWRNDGLPGDQLPDSAWSICATIAPYTGTDATISNALAACNTAHPTGGVVVLSAGTFTLSSGINFPSNTTGHLALRGQGAASTKLLMNGSRCSLSAFANGYVCIKSSDNSGIGSPTASNWAQVTSGQTKGSTQLILSSLNTAVVGSVLVLNQCNTGFTDTGLATACAGTPTDNLGYFVCSSYWTATNTGCGVQGEGSGDGTISWRSFASQMEGVVITAINAGGCGATCVTLSKPIENPNWGGNTQAVIIQPLPYVGVENLTIDSTGSSSGVGIFLGNTLHAWVSGVALINDPQYGINLYTAWGPLVKDSYFFGNPTNYGDHNAILTVAGANPLIQNNIFHAVQGGVFVGGTATPSQAGTIAYNFSPVLGHGTCAAAHMVDFHGAGQAYTLMEGNIGFGYDRDGDHGNSNSITDFRNLWTGWVSNGNGQCGTNFNIPGQNNGHDQTSERMYFGSRYGNIVFDRIGTPGYTFVYQSAGAFDDGRVYIMGAHQGSMPVDSLVASTTMRWGNWDVVNGSDQFNSAEVPTTAPSYPNAVPANHNGPDSFYLPSRPAWFGSTPFPIMGPDVTAGNLGVCSGTLNASGLFNGVPATNASQCRGSGLSSAWNNSVNANPAMQYYLQLGGLPDGSGPVLTSFDAGHYYNIVGTVATPTFSPVAGSYPSAQAVTISSITPGTTICWTNDGTLPATNGNGVCVHGFTYSGPVTVASSQTLQAVGTKNSFSDSSVASAAYSISSSQVATPTFSPGSGSYQFAQNISISSTTSGAAICFTIDGTTPTTNGAGVCVHGTTYSSPILILTTTTLEAIGTESGFTDSAFAFAPYKIIPVSAGAPTMFAGAPMSVINGGTR